MCKSQTTTQGFSLVELSIVLVILGLLVGGILGGQSLIHAAQLRSVTQDLDRYNTAINTFRMQYNALPGDMPNAVRFWGAQAGGTADGLDATCTGLGFSSPATDQKTCNGDGDGKINGTQWSEIWRLWQHLANAGLIEGTYAGVNGHATIVYFGKAGFNMPSSRATGGGFVIGYNGFSGAGHFHFTGQNTYRYGAGEGVDEPPGMLSTTDAWNIDKKIDDGRPGIGNVRGYPAATRADCVSTNDGETAEYLLQNNGEGCTLFVISGF